MRSTRAAGVQRCQAISSKILNKNRLWRLPMLCEKLSIEEQLPRYKDGHLGASSSQNPAVRKTCLSICYMAGFDPEEPVDIPRSLTGMQRMQSSALSRGSRIIGQ